MTNGYYAQQQIDKLKDRCEQIKKRIARLENLVDGIREAAQTARDDEELRRYLVQTLLAD